MIDYLKNTRGVSCVEIYFLAYLAFCGIDERILYGESFNDIKQTVRDFVQGKYNFVTYPYKERLHNTAKKMGMLEITSLKKDTDFSQYDIFLYEVSPAYRSGLYLNAWRDDHYLMLHNGEWYDCFPPQSLTRFDKSFLTGKSIAMKVIKPCAPLLDKAFEEQILTRIACCENGLIDAKSCFDNLPYIRDALLFSKVMRERLNDIFQLQALQEQIAVLQKACAVIETYRLRGKMPPLETMFEKLQSTEEVWIKQLLNK